MLRCVNVCSSYQLTFSRTRKQIENKSKKLILPFSQKKIKKYRDKIQKQGIAIGYNSSKPLKLVNVCTVHTVVGTSVVLFINRQVRDVVGRVHLIFLLQCSHLLF